MDPFLIEFDNTQRDLHGALLDAEILADVYLNMTGGQVTLSLDGRQDGQPAGVQQIRRVAAQRKPLKIIKASDAELAQHAQRLLAIDKKSDGACLWLKLEASEEGSV